MTVRPYFSFWDELTTYDGLIFKGQRLVVPLALRKEMLQIAYGGRVGTESTLQPEGHRFNSYPASLSKVLPLAHEVPIYGLLSGKASGCNSSTAELPGISGLVTANPCLLCAATTQ